MRTLVYYIYLLAVIAGNLADKVMGSDEETGGWRDEREMQRAGCDSASDREERWYPSRR
jgi:hypothetical protein